MSELIKGIITKALSGFYYVTAGDAVYECKARGIFRKKGAPPLVGDNAVITLTGASNGVVEEITERKTEFGRPPVANLSRLIIVSSYTNPAPNTLLIDRMTAICESKDVEPIIVFNKCDEGNFDVIADVYRKAGFTVIVTSCETGEGIEELKSVIGRGISAFAGNSGVGKSSLINRINPEFALKTGAVSESLGRGRHTTRHVELFRVGDGYLADTPGFSSFDGEFIRKDELAGCFREFSDFIGACRFNSCSHTGEKGCAVIDAVRDGLIEPSRFESYKALYAEAASVPDWQLNKKR